METKAGGLGIRPEDFNGPCQPCLTECLEEIEKLVKKFCQGFVVKDKFVDPTGAFSQSFVTFLDANGDVEYPSGAVSGGMSPTDTSAFVEVVVERCTRMGDIRIAYSDHYLRPVLGSDDLFERTFMKRSEEWWAEYNLGANFFDDLDAEEKAAAIANWIKCRHLNTDHEHDLTGGGKTYKETVDDCVDGIWDFNLADTFTTIEKVDIYVKTDYFSTFPICGGLKITDSKEMHEYYYGDDGCASSIDDAVGFGEAWLLAVAAAYCPDASIAERSMRPHQFGTNRGRAWPHPPLPNRSRRFDNADQRKDIGLMRETYLSKLGTIYKTTITKYGALFAPFQKPIPGGSITYYTIMDPHSEGPFIEPGTTGCENGIGLWCAGLNGMSWEIESSPVLLQFPCVLPLKCYDTEWRCARIDLPGVPDTFKNNFCDEQLENIYLQKADALQALLEENEPRILTKGGAVKLDGPIHCYRSEFLSYVRDRRLDPTGSAAEQMQSGFTHGNLPEMCPIENCNGICGPAISCRKGSLDSLKSQVELEGPPYNGKNLKLRNCFTGDHMLPAWCECNEETEHPCSGPIIYKQAPKAKFHCGGENDTSLAAVTFYSAILCKVMAPAIPGPIEYLDDASVRVKWQLNFEQVYQKVFPNSRGAVPAGFGVGGAHSDILDAIKAWTCIYNTNEGVKYETDVEAAEVYFKAAIPKYWYDIEKKFGEGLLYPAYLTIGGGSHAIGRLHTDLFGACVFAGNCPDKKYIEAEHRRFKGPPVCGWEDQISSCGDEDDKIKARIFTGVGAPPPRYDMDDGRVHSVLAEGFEEDEDCPGHEPDDYTGRSCCAGVIDVDDLFIPTEKFLEDCYPDFDPNETVAINVAAGIPREVICLLDENGNIIPDNNPNQIPVFSLKLCFKDDYIYVAHKPSIEVILPEGFFSCGEPIGLVDRSVLGEPPNGPLRSPGPPFKAMCEEEWPCDKCCGIIPSPEVGGQSKNPLYVPVGCALCQKFKCSQDYNSFCQRRDTLVVTCDEGPFCCPDMKWPNPHCIDENGNFDRNLCGHFEDFDGDGIAETYVYDMAAPHPDIEGTMCEDEFWCYMRIAWMTGEKHSPYEVGYLWQTYYGWYPEVDSISSDTPRCYYESVHPRSPNLITKCCTQKFTEPGFVGSMVADPTYSITGVPCELFIISKEKADQDISLEIGDLPITITLE